VIASTYQIELSSDSDISAAGGKFETQPNPRFQSREAHRCAHRILAFDSQFALRKSRTQRQAVLPTAPAVWRGLLFVVLGLNLLLLLEYWLGWLPLCQPQPHLRHVG